MKALAALPFGGAAGSSNFGRTFAGFGHNFSDSLAGVCLVLDTIPSGVKFATYQVSQFYPTYHQGQQVFIGMPQGAPDVSTPVTSDAFDVPAFSVEGLDVDQNFIWLLDCAVPAGNLVTESDFGASTAHLDDEPLVRYLRLAFEKILANKLPVRNIIAHAAVAKELSKLPHRFFETHHTLHSAAGTLWGASLFASSKVPKNVIYTATIPEYLGVLSVTADEKRAGMAIVTPPGVAKIVLPADLLR